MATRAWHMSSRATQALKKFVVGHMDDHMTWLRSNGKELTYQEVGFNLVTKRDLMEEKELIT